MARYIDADALIAKVCEHCELRQLNICINIGDLMGCRADEINTAPTVTVPHWIPVKERLPDNNDGEFVLTIGAKGGYSIAYADSFRLDSYSRDRGCASCICPNQRNSRYVTHWMPLPEPPKENKDNDN